MKKLMLLPLLLVGCTNHNDTMVAYYTAIGQIKAAQIKASVEVEKERTAQAVAYANAPTGGMTVKDPNSGFETTYTNLNPWLFNNRQNFAGNVGNSPLSGNKLPVPVKKENGIVKAAKSLGNFALALANPAANYLMHRDSMKANIAMRVSDNERWIAQADSDLQAQLGMFDAMSGFGDNMQVTAESALGQMQILGSNYADMTASNVENYTTNYKNDSHTHVQLERYQFETTSESSSISTFTEQYPEWADWPVVEITPNP